MQEGATLMLMVYYRDDSGNMVPIATTPVVHSMETFPNRTKFVDFQVDVPAVGVGDPASGRQIGIQIMSGSTAELAGGYWDIDNVRLRPVYDEAPSFTIEQERIGDELRITWPSMEGYIYQVKSATVLNEWSNYEEPLAGTGAPLSLTVPLSGPARFFTVEATPAE